MPFILRNVALLGVDSVMAPLSLRQQAWQRLARDLPAQVLESMTQEVQLDQAVDQAAQLMAGKVHGRVVVKIQ
jgi:acrylyl-CoA reductase (NADPH)